MAQARGGTERDAGRPAGSGGALPNGSGRIHAAVVRGIVGDHSGEVSVAFTNPTARPLCDVVLAMEPRASSSAWGSRLFSFVPAAEHGGYEICELAPHETVERVFTVRPLGAEAGKSYPVHAVAEYTETVGEREAESRRVRSAAPVELVVEARPEVYLAIGALEQLRHAVGSKVEEWIKLGHAAHDRRNPTALPSGDLPDLSRLVLSEATFATVLGLVELGTRLFGRSMAGTAAAAAPQGGAVAAPQAGAPPPAAPQPVAPQGGAPQGAAPASPSGPRSGGG